MQRMLNLFGSRQAGAIREERERALRRRGIPDLGGGIDGGDDDDDDGFDGGGGESDLD